VSCVVRVGVYGACGVRAEVHAPAPVDDFLSDALADLRTPRSIRLPAPPLRVRRSPAGFDVWWRHQLVAWDVDAAHAVAAVLSTLNEMAARAMAPTNLVLHASVVDVGGAAVAFIGHSGSGKSTLTTAAVQRGHGFIADELGIVSDEGLALAFHRPIGLRSASAAILGVPAMETELCAVIHPVRASAIGRLADRVPLRLLVLLGPHSVDREARVLSPAEAMFELVNQTIGTELAEPATFRRIDRLVRRVPATRLPRADPATMLDQIELLVSGAAT
jgi:hypothetical protein